jgi:DNA-directed RNA polymerase specialized sigma24 family protein
MNPHFNSKSVEEGKKVVFQTKHKPYPNLDEASMDSKFVDEGKEDISQSEPELHSDLDMEMVDILKPGSNNAVFIRCTNYLKRFNLQDKFDAAFVINEAYMRARKTLGDHDIYNYPGWIRATCYNIVRELSRSETEKKTRNNSGFCIDSIPADEPSDWADDDLETVEQKRMRQAFATLSPLEQAILQLKVVEGRRWAEIQSDLIASGFPEIGLNSLSQTKRRALSKLKKIYLNIAA